MPVPNDNSFTLVGDAYGGDLACSQRCGIEGCLCRRDDAPPYLVGVMFDPAGLWKMLLELLLTDAGNAHIAVENDRPRRCGPLVDGENVA